MWSVYNCEGKVSHFELALEETQDHSTSIKICVYSVSYVQFTSRILVAYAISLRFISDSWNYIFPKIVSDIDEPFD